MTYPLCSIATVCLAAHAARTLKFTANPVSFRPV